MINRKVDRKQVDTIDKRWIGNRQIDNRGRDRLTDGQMIGGEKGIDRHDSWIDDSWRDEKIMAR